MAASQSPVVVIGAGFSGLISVKCCLEEGRDVICFERTDGLGGLWRFREEDIDGVPSVMRSTVIDTSKELSSMSDFPPNREYANFMHNRHVLQYLTNYAEHFKLLPHVQFTHIVTDVRRAPTYDTTGEWLVRVKHTVTDKEEEVTASAVMVCIGHHVFPNVPQLPGLNKFRGRVVHSHSYKDAKPFENDRVVIVGLGNSSVDMAVELSRACTQVYLSTRRGAWIYGRMAENGVPFDMVLNTRWTAIKASLCPTSLWNSIQEAQLCKRFDHAKYNLKPKHRLNGQHPTISDEFPCRILCGTVTIKGDVQFFTEEGVYFEGEDEEYKVDSVVLATGYKIQFPFVEQGVMPVTANRVNLYKQVFPPNLKHPTLAVIGLAQPVGAIFPVAEMQSRWVLQVFQGNVSLPPAEEMRQDIAKHQREVDTRYVPSLRHTIQVDYVPYMDDLASRFGVKPNLLKLLFTDPRLFYAVLTYPCVPYQFRLQGVHAWNGAREAILDLPNRVDAPLSTRHVRAKKETAKRSRLGKVILISFILAGGAAAYLGVTAKGRDFLSQIQLPNAIQSIQNKLLSHE